MLLKGKFLKDTVLEVTASGISAHDVDGSRGITFEIQTPKSPGVRLNEIFEVFNHYDTSNVIAVVFKKEALNKLFPNSVDPFRRLEVAYRQYLYRNNTRASKGRAVNVARKHSSLVHRDSVATDWQNTKFMTLHPESIEPVKTTGDPLTKEATATNHLVSTRAFIFYAMTGKRRKFRRLTSVSRRDRKKIYQGQISLGDTVMFNANEAIHKVKRKFNSTDIWQQLQISTRPTANKRSGASLNTLGLSRQRYR